MHSLTPLQSRIADKIVSHARLFGWEPGHHLTEDSLLPVLGTSRTPIRAAMAWLETNGVLEKRPNRGFFLKTLPHTAPDTEVSESEEGGERIYLAIAKDRLAHTLPNTVSENELIRRYEVSRAQLRLVLSRIATEGWIERKPGRGWAFLPIIDTLEAYREAYRFRQMVEPAALRSSDFKLDFGAIEQLRAQQRAVIEGGYLTLSQVELFEMNSRFHEVLVAMGQNRFITQALMRINQLRRLYEIIRPFNRERSLRVGSEHLAILDPLEQGQMEEAALMLERHLFDATQEKASAHAPMERYP